MKWHVHGSPCTGTGEAVLPLDEWKERLASDRCRRCEAWTLRRQDKIRVHYNSIDRARQHRDFRTIDGARRYAQRWVGEYPEIGPSYAVSGDGIGKIRVTGCTLADLFPGAV